MCAQHTAPRLAILLAEASQNSGFAGSAKDFTAQELIFLSAQGGNERRQAGRFRILRFAQGQVS